MGLRGRYGPPTARTRRLNARSAGSAMVSRSQVRRAGERLRRAGAATEADRQIYSEYRDTFAEPLREVAEAIQELAEGAPVQSRLKRFETVVKKLRRGTSDLSRLEDIAGCRVVPPMREQRQVLDRIRSGWEVVRERDYRRSASDGYRALHIVVRAQGRPVEVQLRTELEDLWANVSEALAERLDPELKYGGGPPDVRGLLDSMSSFCEQVDTLEAARCGLVPIQRGPWGNGAPHPGPAIELARLMLHAIAAIDRDVPSGRLAADIGDDQRRALSEALAAYNEPSWR